MLKKSKFLSHVLTLLTGSALAQVILFGVHLLLARIYMPQMFGYLAIYSATVLLIGELSNGRYNLAIFLPSKLQEVVNIVTLCLVFTLAATLLSALASFLVLPFFLTGPMKVYFYFLPFSILMAGGIQAFTAFLNRQQQYKVISVSKLLQTVALSAVSLYAGWTGATLYGLLAGLLAGQLACFVIVAIYSWVQARKVLADVHFADMRKMAREYISFPRYSIGSALLNTASRQSPIYLLELFFGTSVVGNFSMAFRLLSAPVMLIAGAYGQVFYERANIINRETPARFGRFIMKNIRNLVIIGIIPTVVIMIWGVDITVALLGSHWQAAGKFVTLLAPWTLLLFINNPLSYVFNIKNKLRNELIYNIFIFSSRVLALIIGGLLASAIISVGAFSAVGVLFNLFLIWYVMRISGVSPQKYLWKK